MQFVRLNVKLLWINFNKSLWLLFTNCAVIINKKKY